MSDGFKVKDFDGLLVGVIDGFKVASTIGMMRGGEVN